MHVSWIRGWTCSTLLTMACLPGAVPAQEKTASPVVAPMPVAAGDEPTFEPILEGLHDVEHTMRRDRMIRPASGFMLPVVQGSAVACEFPPMAQPESLIWEPHQPPYPVQPCGQNSVPYLDHFFQRVSGSAGADAYTDQQVGDPKVAVERPAQRREGAISDPIPASTGESAAVILDIMDKLGSLLDDTEFAASEDCADGDARRARKQELVEYIRDLETQYRGVELTPIEVSAVPCPPCAKTEAQHAWRPTTTAATAPVQPVCAPNYTPAVPSSPYAPAVVGYPQYVPPLPPMEMAYPTPTMFPTVSPSIVQVDVADDLRDASQDLDDSAMTLEENGEYELADEVRAIAQRIRVKARDLTPKAISVPVARPLTAMPVIEAAPAQPTPPPCPTTSTMSTPSTCPTPVPLPPSSISPFPPKLHAEGTTARRSQNTPRPARTY